MKVSDILKNLDVDDSDLSGDIHKDVFDYCRKYQIDLEGFGPYVGFRLSFGKMMSIYTVSRDLINKALDMDIKTMPTGLPERLQSPFLFEAEGDNVLYSDIAAIGGYLIEGDLVILTAYNDEETAWQHERGAFDGRTVESIEFDEEPDIGRLGKKMYDRVMDKSTFAFVTAMASMMDDEKPQIKESMLTDKTNWLERKLFLKEEGKDKIEANP